jgi:hypothetical protein
MPAGLSCRNKSDIARRSGGRWRAPDVARRRAKRKWRFAPGAPTPRKRVAPLGRGTADFRSPLPYGVASLASRLAGYLCIAFVLHCRVMHIPAIPVPDALVRAWPEGKWLFAKVAYDLTVLAILIVSGLPKELGIMRRFAYGLLGTIGFAVVVSCSWIGLHALGMPYP